MAPKKESNEPPKKNEFGTGLRAQLEKRRDDGETAAPAESHPNVELRLELTARPSDSEPLTVVSNGATEDLRKQLAAAQKREEELKAALAEQQEVFEAGIESEHGLSRRAAAPLGRGAHLAQVPPARQGGGRQ